jgi:hypothetical protein
MRNASGAVPWSLADIPGRCRRSRTTGCLGWDPFDGLPTGERELVMANFEDVGKLVGTGSEGW